MTGFLLAAILLVALFASRRHHGTGGGVGFGNHLAKIALPDAIAPIELSRSPPLISP
jgi:hypothetical protein